MDNKKFTLDHLTSVHFEEFCYELLISMGFKNVKWRKGTGLSSSPSDQGRDIECEYVFTDVDDSVRTERWFIECKHYKKGVPPEKIQGALSWASIEQPDVLVLITSNFLSNPTKSAIKLYQENNKAGFRIKTWELPDLESYSQGKVRLLSKYKLKGRADFLDVVHPAHLEYIRSTHINTLDDLFCLLDKFNDDEKMRITGLQWEALLHPRYKKTTTGEETMGELRIDPISYNLFKDRCYEISNTTIPDYLLTNFLVNQFLQETFYRGDKTSTKRYKTRMSRIRELIDSDNSQISADKKSKSTTILQGFIDAADASYEKNFDVYIKFCNEVVSPLLLMPGGSVE